jgi:hypothetical protein
MKGIIMQALPIREHSQFHLGLASIRAQASRQNPNTTAEDILDLLDNDEFRENIKQGINNHAAIADDHLRHNPPYTLASDTVLASRDKSFNGLNLMNMAALEVMIHHDALLSGDLAATTHVETSIKDAMKAIDDMPGFAAERLARQKEMQGNILEIIDNDAVSSKLLEAAEQRFLLDSFTAVANAYKPDLAHVNNDAMEVDDDLPTPSM